MELFSSFRAIWCFELFANSSSMSLNSKIGMAAFSLPHITPSFVKSYYHLGSVWTSPPAFLPTEKHARWGLKAACLVKMFAIKSCWSYMVPIATDGMWTTYAPGNVSKLKLIIKCKETQTHTHTRFLGVWMFETISAADGSAGNSWCSRCCLCNCSEDGCWTLMEAGPQSGITLVLEKETHLCGCSGSRCGARVFFFPLNCNEFSHLVLLISCAQLHF